MRYPTALIGCITIAAVSVLSGCGQKSEDTEKKLESIDKRLGAIEQQIATLQRPLVVESPITVVGSSLHIRTKHASGWTCSSPSTCTTPDPSVKRITVWDKTDTTNNAQFIVGSTWSIQVADPYNATIKPTANKVQADAGKTGGSDNTWMVAGDDNYGHGRTHSKGGTPTITVTVDSMVSTFKCECKIHLHEK